MISRKQAEKGWDKNSLNDSDTMPLFQRSAKSRSFTFENCTNDGMIIWFDGDEASHNFRT